MSDAKKKAIQKLLVARRLVNEAEKACVDAQCYSNPVEEALQEALAQMRRVRLLLEAEAS